MVPGGSGSINRLRSLWDLNSGPTTYSLMNFPQVSNLRLVPLQAMSLTMQILHRARLRDFK